MNENIIHIRNDEEAILSFKNLYKKFGYKNMGISKSTHGGVVWYDMYLDLTK